MNIWLENQTEFEDHFRDNLRMKVILELSLAKKGLA
jgi:hypothetical protein